MSLILSIGLPLIAIYFLYKWGSKKLKKIEAEEKKEEISEIKEKIELENELCDDVKNVNLGKVQKNKDKLNDFLAKTKEN